MNPTHHSPARRLPRRAIAEGRERISYSGAPKRILDILLTLLILVVLSPLMAAAAAAVALEGGGGVIFRQIRMGRDMKPFVCYKFRTMRSDAPADCASAALERPELYITRVGRLLRRISIDELPQLFNVLRGDMSLVGPRPVIVGERELIELRRRLGVYTVSPGITGLAQIRGRDCVSLHRKAALDCQYVGKMSMRYDLYLIFLTVFSVLGCRGVREGKASKEECDA